MRQIGFSPSRRRIRPSLPEAAEAREALELGDRSHLAPVMMPESHFCQGRLAEAREAAEEGFRMAPWDAVTTGVPRPSVDGCGRKGPRGGVACKTS